MDIGGPVQDIAPETNAAPSANVAPLASGVPGASGTPPPAPSNAMVGLDVSLEERVMMCNGIVKKLMGACIPSLFALPSMPELF